MLEVHPLNLGSRDSQSYRFIYLADHEYKIPITYNSFLIRDNEKNIVVDTGHGSPESPKNKKYHPGFVQSENQRLDVVLPQRFGIPPEDIDIVITSHLHWGHVGDNQLLSGAEFWVQKRELEYARNPPPIFSRMFDRIPGVQPEYEKTVYRVIRRDRGVSDHVFVIHLPGHTPGLHGVVVEAGQRNIVLSQDCIPLYHNLEHKVPCGYCSSIDDWYRSLQKIEELGDLILPGHDPAVFAQFKGV